MTISSQPVPVPTMPHQLASERGSGSKPLPHFIGKPKVALFLFISLPSPSYHLISTPLVLLTYKRCVIYNHLFLNMESQEILIAASRNCAYKKLQRKKKKRPMHFQIFST
jgi:hypothetical protein